LKITQFEDIYFMALLPILTHPNERLHIVAQPVAQVDERIRTLVQDMAETMYASKGIGLAATQVDVHERVVVIDLSEEKNQLLALINPVITKKDGETTYEEGCLSVPGIYEEVTRAETITVEFLDIQGNKQTLDADGLLAICVQHELDHLNGKLFVEYLSPLKQNRIKTKMKKRQRETM
jgi:peptide deformylase